VDGTSYTDVCNGDEKVSETVATTSLPRAKTKTKTKDTHHLLDGHLIS
jgi:hypothetical protein